MREQRRFAEALPLYQRALSIREKILGPNDPAVAVSLSGLGAIQSELGEFALARTLLERALVIDKGIYGSNHPTVAIDFNNLAVLLKDEGKPDEALTLFERALAISEAAYGPNHPQVASISCNMAVLLDHGQPDQLKRALALAKRARAINEAQRPDHPVADESRSLARDLKAQRRCRTCQALGSARVTIMTCTNCMNEWYCSAKCQKKDWGHHKAECAKPAAVVEA